MIIREPISLSVLLFYSFIRWVVSLWQIQHAKNYFTTNVPLVIRPINSPRQYLVSVLAMCEFLFLWPVSAFPQLHLGPQGPRAWKWIDETPGTEKQPGLARGICSATRLPCSQPSRRPSLHCRGHANNFTQIYKYTENLPFHLNFNWTFIPPY